MCGRYSQAKDPATLAEEFDASTPPRGRGPVPSTTSRPPPRCSPSSTGTRATTPGRPTPQRLERSLRAMRWGLVPGWADDPKVGSRMINARADSLTSKPAFRAPPRGGAACSPPTAGSSGSARARPPRKVPYFMTLPGGRSLALAGLWETWRPKDAPRGHAPLISTTVVTIDAAGPLTAIHHRMPLVLPPSAGRPGSTPTTTTPPTCSSRPRPSC